MRGDPFDGKMSITSGVVCKFSYFCHEFPLFPLSTDDQQRCPPPQSLLQFILCMPTQNPLSSSQAAPPCISIILPLYLWKRHLIVLRGVMPPFWRQPLTGFSLPAEINTSGSSIRIALNSLLNCTPPFIGLS